MKIAIRVNTKRIQKFCSAFDIVGLTCNDLKAIQNILAKFIIDPKTNDFYPVKIEETENSYAIIPNSAALKIIRDLPLDQLTELVAEFGDEFNKSRRRNTKWLM